MKNINFYLQFLIYILLVFIVHSAVLIYLNKTVLGNKIIESYLLNIFIGILLYFIIDKHKSKFKDNIGFIFMLSSFFKFGLFFLFINPAYKADGITTKLEFLTFFIPYTFCLIIETRELIKLLNKLEY